MTLVANARMYAVDPAAAPAWATLFHRIAVAANLPLEVIEHPFPLSVSDLWKRHDLACAFMCGLPWARAGAEHPAIAAPVPLMPYPGAQQRSVYWSNLVVAADSPARTLDDLRGARVAYTLLDSQSGFSALRHHLLALGDAAPRFRTVTGPLTTPRRAMEAVADGRVDLAPIDSYAHALLRRHVPALADRVRIVARTAPTPIPLLVASPGLDPAVIARLRAAFLALDDPALLEPLQLVRFATPLPLAEYRLMEQQAQSAEHAGVHDLTRFVNA